MHRPADLRTAVLLVLAISVSGCFAPALQAVRDKARQASSLNKMRQLVVGVLAYQDEHEKWPKRFKDIREYTEGKAGLKKLLDNPATGDNPGYEYVRPSSDNKSSDGKRSKLILIYQLRDGERDRKLAVAYADGHIEKIVDDAIESKTRSSKKSSSKKRSSTDRSIHRHASNHSRSREPAEISDADLRGDYLVGFRATIRYGHGFDRIASLEPIYRNEKRKDISGQTLGEVHGHVTTFVAKPGYAVGAINMQKGLALSGFKLVFMKRSGVRLDPTKSYKSKWFGSNDGQSTVLDSDGLPITEIEGHANHEFIAQLKLLTPAGEIKAASGTPRRKPPAVQAIPHARQPFTDSAPRGSYLVGFRSTIRYGFAVDCVASLEPIYRNDANKETPGKTQRNAHGHVTTIVAKPGYAVGAINMRKGMVVSGFEIVFMKKSGSELDPTDSYQSKWYGGQGGGPRTIDSDQYLVTGIEGRANHEFLMDLKLISGK
jgi:hypothetical protein